MTKALVPKLGQRAAYLYLICTVPRTMTGQRLRRPGSGFVNICMVFERRYYLNPSRYSGTDCFGLVADWSHSERPDHAV